MTDADTPPSGRAADELLAMELALGLLAEPERLDAERRVKADPDFAALHARWERLVLALLEGREEQPPQRVWAGVARRLPVDRAVRSLRLWKAATAIAASVALALGATLVLDREPLPARVERPARPRPLVAVLASAERQDIVTVSFDPAGRVASALPSRLSTDGRTAELWVIPAGGKPVAAGLLRSDTRTTLAAEPQVAALLVPGATLAISLEPAGGSPGDAPTGPVILTGTIVRS